MNTSRAMSQYQQVNVGAAVEEVHPHTLIEMLMQGALDRLAKAKGAMSQGNQAAMSENLSKAMAIISGLKDCLDHEKGGDISANLDALYDYMNRRLIKVHREKSSDGLDEVARLLGTVKSGWDGIREEALKH